MDALAKLWADVDRAFDRAADRHPGALACRSGCADCCVGGLVVTPAETDALRAWAASLSAERREAIARLVARPETSSCVALDDEASCSVYAARPLVCRTFGLMHRVLPDPVGERPRRLPLLHGHGGRVVETCYKNFVGVPPEAVDADCIVHQDALRGRIAALSPRGEPVPLADVLRAIFPGHEP